MRLTLLLFCVQVTVFTGSVAFAQTSAPVATPSSQMIKPPPQRVTTPQVLASNHPLTTQSDVELMLLREQNKLIEKFQGSLLSTVYWSLGVVFTLAILLAGFGWWSNFKLYENDKKRLQDDLEVKINELDATLALRIEENRGELERALGAKSDATFNGLLAEASDLRKQLVTIRAEIATEVKQLKATAELSAKDMSNTNKSIALTEANLRQVEEYIWDLKNIPGNILITQGQGLTSAMEAQDLYQIQSVLDRMKLTISTQILPNGLQLHKDIIERIDKKLEKAMKFSKIEVVKVAEVQDLLREIPVKES